MASCQGQATGVCVCGVWNSAGILTRTTTLTLHVFEVISEATCVSALSWSSSSSTSQGSCARASVLVTRSSLSCCGLCVSCHCQLRELWLEGAPCVGNTLVAHAYYLGGAQVSDHLHDSSSSVLSNTLLPPCRALVGTSGMRSRMRENVLWSARQCQETCVCCRLFGAPSNACLTLGHHHHHHRMTSWKWMPQSPIATSKSLVCLSASMARRYKQSTCPTCCVMPQVRPSAYAHASGCCTLLRGMHKPRSQHHLWHLQQLMHHDSKACTHTHTPSLRHADKLVLNVSTPVDAINNLVVAREATTLCATTTSTPPPSSSTSATATKPKQRIPSRVIIVGSCCTATSTTSTTSA